MLISIIQPNPPQPSRASLRAAHAPSAPHRRLIAHSLSGRLAHNVPESSQPSDAMAVHPHDRDDDMQLMAPRPPAVYVAGGFPRSASRQRQPRSVLVL